MGGTSTDVAMIKGGVAPVSNEIEVEYAMPIHVPMVDVRTVGAGGGSIARIDAGGMLRVGPESAGSTPGPICYGRGGTRITIPTQTDPWASSDSQVRAGGRRGICCHARAGCSTARHGVEQAAEAVIRIANTHMAGAIRMVSISMGLIHATLRAGFGGAGPLHAVALAKPAERSQGADPACPGITNAQGGGGPAGHHPSAPWKPPADGGQ